MEGQRGMRAADADREAVAERLRVALEEGRLDLHEYDERLVRAYGAKTYADLDEVLTDLPGPTPAQRATVVPAPPAPAPPVAATATTPVGGDDRSRLRRIWLPRLRRLWMPWLRVAGLLGAIWLVSAIGSGDFSGFWPAWVLGPWGALLVMQSVGLLDQGHGRSRDRRRKRRRGH